MELSQAVVLHKLDITHRSVEDEEGIVYEANVACTSYIVFDSDREALLAFGANRRYEEDLRPTARCQRHYRPT